MRQLLRALLTELRLTTTSDVVLGIFIGTASFAYKHFFGGGLSGLDALSVIVPIVWALSAWGTFLTIRAASRLHKSSIASWEEWKPAVHGSERPQRPAPGKISLHAGILALCFVALGVACAFLPTKPPQDPDAERIRAKLLSIVADAVRFNIRFHTNGGIKNHFKLASGSLYDEFERIGSFGSNRVPARSEHHKRAWNASLGSVLPCSPEGISAAITFKISEHPFLFLTVQHRTLDRECEFTSFVSASPTVTNRFIDHIRDASYYLDFPFARPVALRSFFGGDQLKFLAMDNPPTWGAFVIDSPPELHVWISTLQCRTDMHGRPSCSQNTNKAILENFAAQRQNDFEGSRPEIIEIETELMDAGPKITKQYSRVPGPDRRVSGNSLRFVWKLKHYAEIPGDIEGGKVLPPSKDRPIGPRL